MSIRGLFALEFPVEMSSMTFPLSGWLIPFEIPAMLLGRVAALVNSSPAPAAASAPPLPPRAPMTELAARRARLMLGLTAVPLLLPSYGDERRSYQLLSSFFLSRLVVFGGFKEHKNAADRLMVTFGIVIWKF